MYKRADYKSSRELCLIATTVNRRGNHRETSSDQTKRMSAHTRVRTEDSPKSSRGIEPEFISQYMYVREVHQPRNCTAIVAPHPLFRSCSPNLFLLFPSQPSL